MGPIEFMVIRFEGNKFSGEMMPELENVLRQGAVRLIDFLFLMKDPSGNMRVMDLSDLPDEDLQHIYPEGEMLSWFAQDDVDDVAAELPNNSSAAMLLFEHTWAEGLSKAIARAGGERIVEGVVAREVADQVAASLASQRKAA